ncbi:MAG: right-handed parallel beta-helix repeat-containing protein [Dongiaceae bacterium]
MIRGLLAGWLLLGCLAAANAAAQDIIYAVPDGRDGRLSLYRYDRSSVLGPDGRPIAGPLMTLDEALNRATAGTVIQLLPGRYERDGSSDGMSFSSEGEPNRPIVLRGMGSDTIIDAKSRSVLSLLGLTVTLEDDETSTLFVPDFRKGVSCLRLDNKQWIEIENVTFQNCADAAVHARNSQYITLRNSRLIGGLYGFFAEGTASHHFLIEGNFWVQDESQDMWRRKHWCEYKHGKLKSQAGALFASQDIAGEVIFRGNNVSQAFNGVRMDISTALRQSPEWRGKLNANVEIYGNQFHYIRDNAIEPEYDAVNWWIHDNEIHNVHAWFSFDGLRGGPWYLFQNRGWFDDKPSRECRESAECRAWQRDHPDRCGDLHDGGRVFKFRPDGRYAPGPLYAFNNSWYLRASLIKDGRIGRIGHWNNAIEFCVPADANDELCDGAKPFFNGFVWDDRAYQFQHDLSNHPDFPERLRQSGYGVSGIGAPSSQSLFVDAKVGDLRLADRSPGTAAGCKITMDDDGFLSCPHAQAGEPAPDIGAQTKGSAAGPFYRARDTGGYPAPPRIVGLSLGASAIGGGSVEFEFSTAISLSNGDVRVELDHGPGLPPLRTEPCRATGHRLSCALPNDTALPEVPLRAVRLPAGLVGPSGLPAISWGAMPGLVRIAP